MACAFKSQLNEIRKSIQVVKTISMKSKYDISDKKKQFEGYLAGLQEDLL